MENTNNVVNQPNSKDKKLEIKANILKAFLFSLLIMLAGAVLWGVIYALGFFSAWIAFIPAFGAILVYKKFKQDGKVGMLFYILLLSLLFNYFAMIISATVVVLKKFPGNSFGEIFSLAFQVSFGDGIGDTLGCIGFTALGVGLGYVSAIQQAKKNQMEKASSLNTTTFTPMPNGSVAPIQDQTVEIGAPAEENKAEKILTELAGYVEMYEGKLVEKEDFMKLVGNFNKETLSKLTEEEKANIVVACANAEENENREKARKLLVKLLAK